MMENVRNVAKNYLSYREKLKSGLRARGGAPITEVGVGPLLATYAVLYLILAPILIASAYAFANLMYNKYHYWVTDQRVVWKHGVIGIA